MSLGEATAALTAPGAPFEMEEVEVRGVPTRVWKHAPRTLRDILEASRSFGDRPFLVYEDERTTFDELFRQAATLARRLIERYGVEKGDRVAIAMRNYPEWVVAFWGAAAAGAVVVPLNAWWTGPELEYGLVDSGTKVVFADGERADRLRPHYAALDLAGAVVARAGDLDPGEDDFGAVIGEAAADAQLPDVDLDPDDDATIFYTSGTTGHPKGALGTHRNICTNLVSLGFVAARGAIRAGKQPAGTGGGAGSGSGAQPAGDKPQDASLISVPFFHATGCHSTLVANMAAGRKLVIMYKWDAERALELIERERVSTFGGVPAMVWQVLESPSFEKRDLSSVKSIGYGGAPAPPELVRRIEELFPGRTPSNGYGLTETSSVTTMNAGADYLRKPESVGPPVAVCDVRVVDAEANDVLPGDVGELWIKGPNVVKGYWNKPDATAASFTDGWLRTGDVTRIDDEGFVYIVDRAKDMVIRGGENVYCAEVEAALFEHPAVTDAAVIGVPHHVLGEEVGAVVQLKPGASATADELRRHVGERLAAFKVPAHVWFRSDELPRNPAGKILKRELRDEVVGA